MIVFLVLASLSPIEDDYPKALQQARKLDRPILVDLWATWCHSCLSMRSYVLTDPSLQSLEGRVVFVALDTEREKNAKQVATFAPTVWPTFLVVDQKSEKVLARLPGSATAREFLAFVKGALEPLTGARAELARADDMQSSGEKHIALPIYEKIAADTTLDASIRGRAGLSASLLLMADEDKVACAKKSASLAGSAPGSSYEAATWGVAAWCELATAKPSSAMLDTAKAKIEQAIRTTELNVDDKSDLYDSLSEIATARGDKAGAQKVRLTRLALLESAAKGAASPEAAQTFDAHRTDVYLALGRYDDAIAMLTASEKRSPLDYNPPARLARAYLAKKDLPAAIRAIERARACVYGPRAASILMLEGEIALALGDKLRAKTVYQQAQALLQAQPPTLGAQHRLRQIDKLLASF